MHHSTHPSKHPAKDALRPTLQSAQGLIPQFSGLTTLMFEEDSIMTAPFPLSSYVEPSLCLVVLSLWQRWQMADKITPTLNEASIYVLYVYLDWLFSVTIALNEMKRMHILKNCFSMFQVQLGIYDFEVNIFQLLLYPSCAPGIIGNGKTKEIESFLINDIFLLLRCCH